MAKNIWRRLQSHVLLWKFSAFYFIKVLRSLLSYLIYVLSRPGDDAGGHSTVRQYTRARVPGTSYPRAVSGPGWSNHLTSYVAFVIFIIFRLFNYFTDQPFPPSLFIVLKGKSQEMNNLLKFCINLINTICVCADSFRNMLNITIWQ